MGQPLTRAYRKGELESENFPVEDVSEYLKQPDTVVWVDLCGPSMEQLHDLGDELGLHELAVEDALGRAQRPKLDRYETFKFLSTRAVSIDEDSGELGETEVDAFINERWLITVRSDDRFPIQPVVDRWDRSPDLAVQGVSFLLYGLIDVVVDGYFETIEVFDAYYDEVSEMLFADEPLEPKQQRHWFDMRRSLTRFHRLVVPLREAISSLMRREQDAVSEDLYPYFQDVYDHLLRVSESSDSLRELVSTIVETNLSLRDHRQNLIVKKVSSWAAIIAVPALITGYFGMNVPFPGSGETVGVVAATTLIIAACAGLYVVFKRQDWL
jgi:magnesium transporter